MLSGQKEASHVSSVTSAGSTQTLCELHSADPQWLKRQAFALPSWPKSEAQYWLRQRKPPPIASNFHFKVHVPGMDKWIHRKRPVLLLAQVWSNFMCRNQLFELRSHHDSTNCLERHPYQSDFLPRFWSIRSCFDFLISRGFGGHGLAAGQLTAGSQPLHSCHH